MRVPRFFALLLPIALASGQTIVSIAGVGPSHRADIDGKDALAAPLNAVYGVLLSRATGRLILHDEGIVERIEPDGTLLAVAGAYSFQDGAVADGTPASALRILTLRGMAEDAAGALYLSDAGAGRVYRIGRDGLVTTFAGGVGGTSSGDGGPATRAPLFSPRGLVFDSKGNLYIADAISRSIRRVSPDGIITTVYALPPTRVVNDSLRPFPYFEGLAIDAADNLYAAEYSGDQVLRIAPDGTVSVAAGTGTFGFSGDGGRATEAQLNQPSGVAVDASGALYIADTGNHRIRKVAPDGTITTVAGSGTRGFSGDGGSATDAQLSFPAQVLPAPDGSLYIADYANRRVRVVSPDGTIRTVAGSSANPKPPTTSGPGDGGPAVTASLATASVAVFDPAGNLLVAELGGNRVRKIAPDGTITTVAGNGIFGVFSGDGGPAVNAGVNGPWGMTVDAQGAIYVATADSRVRRIDPGGTITTVAGTGTGTGLVRSQGDGGPAVAATLNEAKGVAVDAAGNLYIADTSNARLRMVDRNGVIRTIAGPGQLGTDYWNAVAIDPRGNIYVAITHSEISNVWSIVDRVASDGSRTRVAGNAQPCDFRDGVEFPYDGQAAASVPLCTILGLTFDAGGLLYIPESFYGVVLRVNATGAISRIAGSSRASEFGDGGPALAARLGASGYFSPASVAIDRTGNLFLPAGNRVREVTPTPLAIKLSRDRLDLQAGESQTIAVATNFAEPFPYVVKTQTADGGDWLTANRASGVTGEALVVTARAAGLAAGEYRGTITVQVAAGTPLAVDLPVSLTVR